MQERQNDGIDTGEMTDNTPKNSKSDIAETIGVDKIQAVQLPVGASEKIVGRRRLLIGGGVALFVLAGGGTALSLALMNAKKQTTSNSLLPTPASNPKPLKLIPGEVVLTINAHTDVVTNVLWDRTGRYLASSSYDNTVKLWDVGDIVQKSGSDSPATLSQPAWQTSKDNAPFGFDELHWSADGRKLITLVSDQDDNTRPIALNPFVDSDKGQLFTNTKIKNAAFSYPQPASQNAMLAAIDIIVRRYVKVDLWQMDKPDVPVGSLIYRDPDQFIGDFVNITIIGWSCDSAQLAAFTSSGHLVIWDVKTRAVKTAFLVGDQRQDDKVVRISRIALSWSPTNPHLLAIFNLTSIAVVDATKGKVLYQLGTDDPDAFKRSTNPKRNWTPHVVAITWSPDGRYIVASYANSNKVYLWDTQTKEVQMKNGLRIQQLIFPQADDPLAHTDAVADISWSPDGRYLATASYDESIKVWKVGV
jgi:WD40 repeat protein